MKKLRVLVLILIASMMTVMFSGCGEGLKLFLTTDFRNQLATRFDENQACLDTLYNAGFISQELYRSITENLASNKDKYANFGEDDTRIQNKLINSVVAIQVIDEYNFTYFINDDGDKVDEWDSDEAEKQILSNYIYEEQNDGNRFGGSYEEGFTVDESFDDNDAISIIDDAQLSEELNEKFKFELWVLDETKTIGGIDEVIECVKSNIGEDGTIKDNDTMALYFKDSGDVLFDSDEELDIFCTTTENYDRAANRPGLDMVINQNGMSVASVRLRELNLDAINDLIAKLGINSAKYVFDIDDKRVYLMEYPAYAVDTVTTDGVTVSSTLERSELGINFRTQQILKYDYSDDGDILPTATVIGEGIDNYKSYLSVAGADSNTAETLSAFVMNGSQTIEIEKGLRSNGSSQGTREVTTSRIILRDYLELTYAPDYIEDSTEDMYVFGRKMRVNITGYNDDGTISISNDNFATFIDLNGDYIISSDGTALGISSKDIMDISYKDGIVDKASRGGENYRVYRLMQQGETDGQEVAVGSELSGTPKITDLGVTAMTTISPVQRFPGEIIDSVDYNSESPNQPIFYCIGTNTDMFSTKLYSSWITSDSDTASVSWWNKWLFNVGYSYKIDIGSVNEYLSGNYAYELSQQGVIILDLETVAKIQEDIDHDNIIKANNQRRTFFKILGWAMIIYSVVLILCWIIDTQLDIGIRLYSIASFGKWRAIKYKADIPDDEVSKKYVDLSKMVLNSFVIMLVGMVLLQSNIVNIIYLMVSKLGKLAESITSMLG